MPSPVASIIGGGLSLVGSVMQSRAANNAASMQSEASDRGIAEQRRQFDMIRELLQPYVSAGTEALGVNRAILGLSGPEAQQAQVSAIENSPLFQSLIRSGEDAILSNASATGGLRGGNTQAALAQFRPAMLSQELQNRYANIAGLTSLGQQSAAGVGTAGLQTGQMISNSLAQQGAARAGGALESGRAMSNLFQMPAQFLAMRYAMGNRAPGSIF